MKEKPSGSLQKTIKGSRKGDLTTGDPFAVMMKYLVPLLLGNLFQQFYSIADSVIVGRMVGAKALAAVGATGTLIALFIMIATGIGAGCSVILSQLFGARQHEKLKSAVSTELSTVLCLSIALSILGCLSCGTLLSWLRTPADIYADAKTYLTIYFYGFSFLFMYNAFTSVFNALGDSKKPLYFLLFSSLLNIALDIVFIRYFHMGVAGAAWATAIAQGVSAVLCFFVLLHKLRRIPSGTYRKYDAELLQKMVRVAVPTVLQQSVVSVGSILIQACVNQFGSVFLAGFTAALRIDNIAILPMVNCGNAVSTFVAQNLGARQADRARKGCRTGVGIAAVFALVLGVSLHLFSTNCIGWFLDSSTAADSIACGAGYLRIVSKFYLFMGLMKILAGVLRGAGDMNWFLACTVVNLIIRVALTYLLAGIVGEIAIAIAIPFGWIAADLVAWYRYRQGVWQKIRLV